MNSRQIIDYIQQQILPALQLHFEELFGRTVIITLDWNSLETMGEAALLQLQHYFERLHNLQYINNLYEINIKNINDNAATKVWLEKGVLHVWLNLYDLEGIPSDSELQLVLENRKIQS